MTWRERIRLEAAARTRSRTFHWVSIIALASLTFCACATSQPDASPGTRSRPGASRITGAPPESSKSTTSEAVPSKIGATGTEQEAPRAIVIRWSTASEFENFGYYVYRGLTPTGPFTRVTEAIIPGNGTTSLPQHYRFADSEVEPAIDYFYYVESVDLSGARRRFTPVRRFRLEVNRDFEESTLNGGSWW